MLVRTCRSYGADGLSSRFYKYNGPTDLMELPERFEFDPMNFCFHAGINSPGTVVATSRENMSVCVHTALIRPVEGHTCGIVAFNAVNQMRFGAQNAFAGGIAETHKDVCCAVREIGRAVAEGLRPEVCWLLIALGPYLFTSLLNSPNNSLRPTSQPL